MKNLSFCFVILAVILVSSCRQSGTEYLKKQYGEAYSLQFTGEESCRSCHNTEYGQWYTSYHHHAMEYATDESVLGDFSGTELDWHGMKSTFYREGADFFIKTEDIAEGPAALKIDYTFGWYPLQQYMVSFPDGRIQVLPYCWDERPVEEGGQKWFHVYDSRSEVIPPGDELHWTGINQNWNYMCASCHSTDLKKNFNLATNQYHTSWEEIYISCEECHGPGSRHISWAEMDSIGRAPRDPNKGLAWWPKHDEYSWSVDPVTGNGVRSVEKESDKQMDLCARCHSRRQQIDEDYKAGDAYLDHYVPSLLEEGLYYADGQQLDEVYVYNSFLQSKMYMHGVTCTDCHNQHLTQTKLPGEKVCFQCHEPIKYAASTHTMHDANSEGSSCIACHMPKKYYMTIDDRADHSMRIPRPDLTLQTGIPNACMNCHEDNNTQWIYNETAKFYGTEFMSDPHFGLEFYNARMGKLEALPGLLKIIEVEEVNPITRASALMLAGNYSSAEVLAVAKNLAADSHPLIRLGVLRAIRYMPVQQKMETILPLLSDSLAAIRIEAASQITSLNMRSGSSQFPDAFNSAMSEYLKSLKFNHDRPEANIGTGNYLREQGYADKALEKYFDAIKVDSLFPGSYLNIADLYRESGEDSTGRQFLEEGIRLNPNSSDLYHALGLLEYRTNHPEQAMQYLKRAFKLNRNNGRYAYVYAVALENSGNLSAAISTLEEALVYAPYSMEILSGLVSYYRMNDQPDRALQMLNRLLELQPDTPEIRALMQELGESN